MAVRSQQTSATNAQLQGSAQKTALPGSSQASGLPQAATTGQAVAVAQASSGGAGQSLNLSQGAAGSNGVSGGVVATGGSQPSMALSQSASAGAAGSCQRKGTGVVQPLPVAAAQAVTVSQGSRTETENATAKKGDTDSGGQQTVGMNLTRTATPAPSQTLISSGKHSSVFFFSSKSLGFHKNDIWKPGDKRFSDTSPGFCPPRDLSQGVLSLSISARS